MSFDLLGKDLSPKKVGWENFKNSLDKIEKDDQDASTAWKVICAALACLLISYQWAPKFEKSKEAQQVVHFTLEKEIEIPLPTSDVNVLVLASSSLGTSNSPK